jgi:hypothetical protein
MQRAADNPVETSLKLDGKMVPEQNLSPEPKSKWKYQKQILQRA